MATPIKITPIIQAPKANLYGYEEKMAKIREEERYIELCGGRPFKDVIEEAIQNGESISVEQLFHLIVNDVHKIFQEDGIQV